MVRRSPLTQLGIQERSGWPITDAALRGPDSYEELVILTDKQRRELVQFAQVPPVKEKQFVEDVTCQIIQYRHEQDCDAQERPAAVAASMRKVIRAVETYMNTVSQSPHSVLAELEAPLLGQSTVDWLKRAEEKVARLEREIEGHAPPLITKRLILHAQHLQKIARTCSSRTLNKKAMQRWLGEALLASGESEPSKNYKTRYFEALILPEAPEEISSS